MTASDYLKVQAALLIAVDGLRRLPLAEFAVRAAELEAGPGLVDAQGWSLVTAPASMSAIARGAQAMVDHGPHSRKPAAREAGNRDGSRAERKASGGW